MECESETSKYVSTFPELHEDCYFIEPEPELN